MEHTQLEARFPTVVVATIMRGRDTFEEDPSVSHSGWCRDSMFLRNDDPPGAALRCDIQALNLPASGGYHLSSAARLRFVLEVQVMDPVPSGADVTSCRNLGKQSVIASMTRRGKTLLGSAID